MPDGAPVSGEKAPELPQQPRPEPGQPVQGQPVQGQPYQPPFYQPQPVPTMPPAPARTGYGNGMAVASLVLGITGVVSSALLVLGVLTLAQTVLAIVFGARGLTLARLGAGRRGMATAGLVLGVVGLAAYLAVGIASGGRLLLV